MKEQQWTLTDDESAEEPKRQPIRGVLVWILAVVLVPCAIGAGTSLAYLYWRHPTPRVASTHHQWAPVDPTYSEHVHTDAYDPYDYCGRGWYRNAWKGSSKRDVHVCVDMCVPGCTSAP